MGVFMKATLMSPNKMVRSLDRAIAHNTLVTSKPRSGTAEVCVQGMCELSHHKTRSHLFWSLFSCNTNVWTRPYRSPQLAELPNTLENFSSSRVNDSHLLPIHQGEVLPKCLPQSKSHL